MLAIIETGGKQYRVYPGQKIKIERLPGEVGSAVKFESILLLGERDNVTIGTPQVKGAEVTGKIIAQGREDTKIVFKYHSKTRERKKKGHRQQFTEVEIVEIK